MSKFLQKVVDVCYWNTNLFSFKIERPREFKFKSGEFVMIGLPGFEKPILRAYSICSPSWEDTLEFYSIIVPNGPFTSKLKDIQINDKIVLMSKSTGTLIIDALKPAKQLFLLSTGTGFAPFASIIRDPETFEKYDHVYITHTCRNIKELRFSEMIVNECLNNNLLKEFTLNKLSFYKTTTQEKSQFNGRITDKINDKSLFNDLGIKDFNYRTDCVMMCGSLEFNNELKEILLSKNFSEGATNNPGSFVLEKAFVG